MKIHRIEIQNIASLKGEHIIDFDKIQMGSGSFAITGDTGAGKSTVLNCVSLALYGRSYKGLNQGDFVTLGEAKGSVKLYFSVSGKKYLSRWSCKVRKKNGEYLKTPTHNKEFFKVNGEQLDILDATPEDVVHLSFDQFCKTVILNQGEFAKFLTSSFRERKDILDKLYQGERLDLFSPSLRQKISNAAQGAEAIKAKIEGLGEGLNKDVDKEGLRELKIELKGAQEQEAQLEGLSQIFKDLAEISIKKSQSKEKIEELDLKIKLQIEEINEFSTYKNNFVAEKETFLKRQKELSPLLHKAISWKEELDKTLPQMAQRSLKLEELDKQKSSSTNELNSLAIKIQAQKKNIEAIEAKEGFKEISEDDTESLRSLIHIYKQKSLEKQSTRSFLDHLNSQVNSLTEEIEAKSTTLMDLQAQLEPLKQTQGSPKEIQDELFAFQRLSAKYDSNAKEINRLEARHRDEQESLKSTRANISSLTPQLDRLEKSLQAQEIAVEESKLDLSIHNCIEVSSAKGECVVCGSQDISALKAKIELSSTEKLEALKETYKKIQDEIGLKRQDLQREKTNQTALLGQSNQTKEAIQSLENEFFAANYDLLKNLNIGQKQAFDAATKTKLFEKLEHLSDELEKAQVQSQNAKDLENRISHIQESIPAQKQKLAAIGKDKSLKSNFLESLSSELSKAWESIALLSGARDIEHANELISSNTMRLKCLRELNDIESKSLRIKDAISNFESRKEELTDSLNADHERVATLRKDIESACPNKAPHQALEELEGEQRVFQDKEKRLEQEHKALELEKSALFSRSETFKEQLRDQQNLMLDLWAKFKDISKAHIEDEDLSKSINAMAQSETPISKDTLGLSWELIKEKLTDHKENVKEISRKTTEYSTLLTRQESAKKAIKELKTQLNKNLGEKEQWEELQMLIGKDEFRNYVLSMVEKMLISQTNVELSKLCDGRYLIVHKQSSARMAPEFYIIDKFRGDESRKVSTLSGGETFMVSLAMAMALAELTRGNADLDSFFIDEGFGTLDQDSLEEALEMLQDIETRGKQIGLISHVKELTQRIPLNIHLHKNRLGNSSIEVVYN